MSTPKYNFMKNLLPDCFTIEYPLYSFRSALATHRVNALRFCPDSKERWAGINLCDKLWWPFTQINFSTQSFHIANFFIVYFIHNQTYKTQRHKGIIIV